MSSVRYASGKKRSTAPLIEAGEYPPQLDASIAKGAWVIGPDGNMFYSNGENWLPSLPQGVEVIIPPWVQVPDGWFAVSASLTGDLANRTVIANRFDISYVLDGAETWPIIDPSNLYRDSAGETPVVSAPEPVGLVEDSTVPQINWFQDVSVDRPQWKQITRTVDGVEKTIDVLEFDNLGQQLKVDFTDQVTGSMVHVTSNGIYILGVDIPAGEYNFGRYQIWDIEEIILLDRSLTSGESAELISELGKQRDRVTEPNFGTDWENAFRDRPEIVSMPSFDFTGVTTLERTFQNAGAENWLSGSFFDTAVDVTYFGRTFIFNDITSIPDGLFDNTPNVTRFNETFRNNDITSIPAGLFDNTPNVTNFSAVFRDNNLSSIPENLFANNPNVTNMGDRFDFRGAFQGNSISSIPAGLFDNTPNITDFSAVFRSNSISSIPAGLFDNTPNVTRFRDTFSKNNITSIPENLFANNPSVTGFNYTFRDNNLTSIPENLFANNPNVTDFSAVFSNNSITSIPENLFANNPNVTTMGGKFPERGPFNSNNLSSIPAGLFDNTPNVTNFGYTFRSNNITSVPAGLFDTQTQATNYEGIFNNNDLDQTSVDNVLVSVQTSADANDLNDGELGIDGGTNATPSQTGKDAADALRARGWTVNLNGY